MANPPLDPKVHALIQEYKRQGLSERKTRNILANKHGIRLAVGTIFKFRNMPCAFDVFFILGAKPARRDNWVPTYKLSAIAPQYSARIKELRDAGYVIENITERVGRQVHGSFRLGACPGEHAQQSIPYSDPKGGQ